MVSRNSKQYMNAYNDKYFKTKFGVIIRIYGNQKNKSIKRGHVLPSYDVDELYEWCMVNGFDELYNNWVKSNYNKLIKPSVDRINDNLPYSIDNIQLVTWEFNNNKAKIDQRSGKLNTVNKLKSVIQYDLDYNILAEFISIREASRITGQSRTNIIKSCKNPNIIHRKSIWKYKE